MGNKTSHFKFGHLNFVPRASPYDYPHAVHMYFFNCHPTSTKIVRTFGVLAPTACEKSCRVKEVPAGRYISANSVNGIIAGTERLGCFHLPCDDLSSLEKVVSIDTLFY
jgi:hypothetical protein